MSSRVLGLVRDAVFSALFGVSALTDSFRIAFQIPNLLRDLFAEGALSSAFVPTFSQELARDGQAAAFRLGNLVMTGVVLVTGVLAGLGIVYAEPLVTLISGGFGDSPERALKMATTVELARVMMPILTLVSGSAVWMGMLNAQSRFLAPALAPALFNVSSIMFGFALLAMTLDQARAMTIFAIGTVASAVVQAFCQLPSLWRLGYRPRPVFAGLTSHPGIRRIMRLMAPALVGLAAVQLNIFVNTRFAALLGTGPPTYLGNAFRLFYLPIGVFGVALATVTTTRVSLDAARGDRTALAARTVEGLRGVWLLASASAVGLIVLAEPVVTLIFQRGLFTREDSLATAAVLQAYMLGVVPYSLVKNLAPAFYVLDRPRLPMLASMMAVAVNIAFNALTYQTLGAPGLALGTTLGAVVNYLILRLAFTRVVGASAPGTTMNQAAALVAANTILGGVAYGLQTYGTRGLHAAGWLDRSGTGLLAALLLMGTIAIAFVVYTRLLAWWQYPGAAELASLPRKLMARLARRRGSAG
jgi:putative peptidoglycan lipid II flippase